MGLCLRLAFSWVLGLTLLVVGSTANADLLVNDWDADLETWRFDFGGVGAGISQDPTEGSPGNAMGAMRLDMPFAFNTFAFTGDLFASEMDFTSYDELLFDIKIDQSSALDSFGNHGFFEFVTREGGGYAFNSLLGMNLPANSPGWMTYSVPTDLMAATRAYTVQLYGGPSQNITGNITIWIDNIRLVNAIPEPTSGLLGLIACVFGTGALRRQV